VLLQDAVGEHASASLRALIEALTNADPRRRPADARAALAQLDTSPGTGAVPLTERATQVLRDAGTRARTAATGLLTTSTERVDGSTSVRIYTLHPRAVGAGLLILAGVIALAIALASGGREGDATLHGPRPAASDAPLNQQLRALDARVRYAARRE
jgi:hypothetical protein